MWPLLCARSAMNLQEPARAIVAQVFQVSGFLAGICCLTSVSEVGRDSPLACTHEHTCPPVHLLLPSSCLLTTSERQVHQQGWEGELGEEACFQTGNVVSLEDFSRCCNTVFIRGANPSPLLHRWGQKLDHHIPDPHVWQWCVCRWEI